jgi:hypothetical protein
MPVLWAPRLRAPACRRARFADIWAIKTADEIALLDHAAALVDGAHDELCPVPAGRWRERRPGQPVPYENGSEEVVNSIRVNGAACTRTCPTG